MWCCLFVLLLPSCGGWEFGWPGDASHIKHGDGVTAHSLLALRQLGALGEIILPEDVSEPMGMVGRMSINDMGLMWGAQ